MGNTPTKESRGEGDSRDRHQLVDSINAGGRPRTRMNRGELGFLAGISNSSASRDRDRPDAPYEHRETRQEREARRLERERVARAKERERSIREEHVDGGYLVTLGTYTGTEDFSKPVVRQLQIERKLAPFWRGLDDWSSSWAEHQLVAAARGLPVPAADAPPDPELISRPPPPDNSANQSLQNLTVPMGPRTLSAASDQSVSGQGSNLASPTTAGPPKSTLKPRAKALAAALTGSRNASTTDLAPKEFTLPHDPFVNGQPIEVYLYKDADDCPICFLSYPPYLNSTRCCGQAICSECFVQIKRTDPHLPEHHPNGETRDPNEGLAPEEPPERLISEPSACPYCQQPEFGVTYEPPPFRRGLVFSSSSSNVASSTAMSSQSSLHSTLSPNPPQGNRRRTHSLSANAPNVITTDRVRPDWATKLAAARSHQARRAAAATALHTAAFLVGGSEQRSILRGSRFSRRGTGTNSAGTETPGGTQGADNDDLPNPENGDPSNRPANGGRRSRMDELEDMMFMEAVRLSLAAEEERKRKEEKALRKDAKKREQAERKALKKQSKDPYGTGASSASGSSLSLGLGRLRGNSAASNLRVEATVQGASQASKSEAPSPSEREQRELKDLLDEDATSKAKGKEIDRGLEDSAREGSSSVDALPIPTGSGRTGSHLRQMSNASSIGSSPAGTPSGSYTGPGFLGPDGSRDVEQDTGSEPMFNFRSLAELVGVNIEDGSMQQQDTDGDSPSGRPLSQVKEDVKEEAEAEHVEEGTKEVVIGGNITLSTESTATEKSDVTRGPPYITTPELTLTPETPMAIDEAASESKQLGHPGISEQSVQAMP